MPDFPPVPTPHRYPLPLHQLIQVAPRPEIDWGGLRIVMRRRIGIEAADRMIDHLLEPRTLVKAHGSAYPILMPDGTLFWTTIKGLNPDGTTGKWPAPKPRPRRR
jgi:hypothetical protein